MGALKRQGNEPAIVFNTYIILSIGCKGVLFVFHFGLPLLLKIVMVIKGWK